jgi:hypothetical protein
VVKELLEAGHEVTGLTRTKEGAKRWTAVGATPHWGSLEDLQSLRRGLGEWGHPSRLYSWLLGCNILAGQPALGKTLLEVIAQEGVERLAIGFDAIEPPIVAQQLAIFVNERAEPRDHSVHIIEGQGLFIVVHGGVLGRAEVAINRFREAGILQSKVLAHDDGVHDRKDAGTLVVIAFHRPVVRKKTRRDEGDGGGLMIVNDSSETIAI